MEGCKIKTDILKEHFIDPKTAQKNTIIHIHTGIFSNTPGMSRWRGINLGKPMSIYDLNGELLFYDFPIIDLRRRKIGLARACANKVLGLPVLTTYMNYPILNFRKAVRRAREIVYKMFKTKTIEIIPICYAYPKIGIAAKWKTKEEQGQVIVDVSDYSVVEGPVKSEARGPGTWSMYENIQIKDVQAAVKRYESYNQFTEEVQKRTGLRLDARIYLKDFNRIQKFLVSVIPFFTTGHLGLNLHGQINNYYCTCATAQMILEFHGYNYTQNQIATAMSTTSAGTHWGPEVAGFETLTNNTFDASTDFSPSFFKAKQEIIQRLPFDYSYLDHSMACSGYREQLIIPVGGNPENSLEIYDPWPVNQGAIRWETWGTETVVGYVYLRPV